MGFSGKRMGVGRLVFHLSLRMDFSSGSMLIGRRVWPSKSAKNGFESNSRHDVHENLQNLVENSNMETCQVCWWLVFNLSKQAWPGLMFASTLNKGKKCCTWRNFCQKSVWGGYFQARGITNQDENDTLKWDKTIKWRGEMWVEMTGDSKRLT